MKRVIHKVKTICINRKKFVIGSGIIAIALIISLVSAFSSEEEMPQIETNRSIELATVYDLTNDTRPLPVLGTIESNTEATIRAERSGEISSVSRKIGDQIFAGQVIAQLKNASEWAEVLRAQGVLQSAQAQLNKVNGSSDESFQLITSAVRNAFTNADDAIRNKVDQLIEDPETRTPEMIVASNNYYIRQEINTTRVTIGNLLNEWEKSIRSIESVSTASELSKKVDEARNNLNTVRSFLDLVARDVNSFESHDQLPQSTIDKYRSDISIARSNINGSINSLISSSNSLSSAIALDGKGEDVLLAEAQVTQAEAGLLAAQARYEETVIRAPISGIVNAVEVRVGDVVSTFDLIAQIVNSGDLEIVAFINKEDVDSIDVGAQVIIDKRYDGTISAIAPAINPQTKKVEIRIGVPEGTQLSNGQSVPLDIIRQTEIDTESINRTILIPISALKIRSGGNYVFTVSEDNTLLEREVLIGSIVGDRVQILDGIDFETIIVVDARGFKAGDSVTQ